VRVIRPERFALPRPASPPSWQEWYRVHCKAAFLAPSLDFACWFHATSPSNDWLLVDAHCPVARGGCIHATGSVFDRAGTLLASSDTQLLCTPVPKPA